MAPSLTSYKDDPRPDASAPWMIRLAQALESETAPSHTQDLTAFVTALLTDDMEKLRAITDHMIVQTDGRAALLTKILAPAARLLGDMWAHDVCDFTTVTLGTFRLDQLMKETAGAGSLPRHDHRILLLPAPGEQHSFGLAMVADAFREGGWCVRSGPAITRPQLLRLVKQEWFDIIGLSISADRWLKHFPACIRAIRAAARNPSTYIMVGGSAILTHPDRTRFLGADAAANNAKEALHQANIFMETSVTAGLHTSKTQLVDAG